MGKNFFERKWFTYGTLKELILASTNFNKFSILKPIHTQKYVRSPISLKCCEDAFIRLNHRILMNIWRVRFLAFPPHLPHLTLQTYILLNSPFLGLEQINWCWWAASAMIVIFFKGASSLVTFTKKVLLQIGYFTDWSRKAGNQSLPKLAREKWLKVNFHPTCSISLLKIVFSSAENFIFISSQNK